MKVKIPYNHTVNQDAPQPSGPLFSELPLGERIQRVLRDRGIAAPTPIQHQAIPPAMEGKDLIGIAQTGTGKTWSFGLPMLERLTAHGGRGLIILPTRELAYQVEESLAPFAQVMGIVTTVFVGGASMKNQIDSLRKNPRILIATPGRLNDHLQQGTVTLKEVKILVLDEADHMLDMGFKPQIERILRHVPGDRQTLLFSATMPPGILNLAQTYMKMPLRIEVAPQGTTAEKVEQELFVVYREEKFLLLQQLLQENAGSVLVFCRTKHGAKKLTRQLTQAGHRAAEIHSNKSLNQRREALEGFKTGRHRVLVATDIAARGIDVTGIELVVNFDPPDDPSDYVHRIGRTARAGKSGKAVLLATPDQAGCILSIEKLIRMGIPRADHPQFPQRGIPSRPEPIAKPAAPTGSTWNQRLQPRAGGGRRRRRR